MNPFPGPQPYRRENQAFFFGREAACDALAESVLSHRFLTVYGPSGAGKSSLLQAGVLPLLEGRRLRSVVVDSWPAHSIVDAGPMTLFVEQIGTQLGIAVDANTSLADTVQRVFRRSQRPVTLVIDQLEQLLLHHDYEVLLAFVEGLHMLQTLPGVWLHVVMSLREDYLGRWNALLRDYPELKRHSFRVAPLTVPEMTGAVLGAVRKAGRDWDQERLRELILEMADRQGAWVIDEAAVESAYVQIVCRALWDGGEGT